MEIQVVRRFELYDEITSNSSRATTRIGMKPLIEGMSQAVQRVQTSFNCKALTGPPV